MDTFSSLALLNPSEEVVNQELIKFALSHEPNILLHDVALRNLLESTFDFADPFPRIESHGRYLFGEFATPTSLIDGKDLFITAHFVISFTNGLVIFRTPGKNPISEESESFKSFGDKFHGRLDSGGRFLLSIIQYIVLDFEQKITEVHNRIDGDLSIITNQIEILGRNVTKLDLNSFYNSATLFNIDILGCRTSIEETLQILGDLAEDKIDLKIVDQDGVREMFTRELEIEVGDLQVRLKHLKSLRNKLQETLKITFKKFEKIEELRQTRATHNMTAIASIMLLPSFLVGFFGQNFAVHDELNFHWGWLVSILLIVSVSVSQIIFFRRKNWL